MRKLAALAVLLALSGLAAGSAQAKLAPIEQKWVTPLLTVWNRQNAGLHLVVPAATASADALVAGTKDNARLTTVLVALVSCKQPIKKAGAPPSPRLTAFRTALTAACTHDARGANDFAKAVGAVRKRKTALARSLLTHGVGEFRKGSTQLAKAKRALTAIGGQNIFKA